MNVTLTATTPEFKAIELTRCHMRSDFSNKNIEEIHWKDFNPKLLTPEQFERAAIVIFIDDDRRKKYLKHRWLNVRELNKLEFA